MNLSPKKHLEESAKHRQRSLDQGLVSKAKRPPRVIVAETSAEFEAKGGRIERILSPQPSLPRLIPCRASFRGKGSQG